MTVIKKSDKYGKDVERERNPYSLLVELQINREIMSVITSVTDVSLEISQKTKNKMTQLFHS